MDDDLDANEEVNFLFFVFNFFAEWREVEFTVCFSFERSLFERTNAHHKTNKQNSGSSIRKIL